MMYFEFVLPALEFSGTAVIDVHHRVDRRFPRLGAAGEQGLAFGDGDALVFRLI